MSGLVAGPPQSAPARPWQFPAFRRATVAGGRLVACHLPGTPLASVSVVVDAGAVAEPSGQQGVALLTARALSEGTAEHDAYGFAVASERLGAVWHADADWDSLRCGFDVPVAALPAAVDLLAEAVRAPAFTEADVARVRDERVDEMMIELSQPRARAAVAFAAELFEPGSRYSAPDGGTVEAVQGLSVDDVRGFHAARFAAGSATLIVAGDLSGLDPAALAARLFDGWAAPTPAAVEPSTGARPGGRRVVVVDRPGSVQSMVQIGHPGPRRLVPDYVPLTTMAFALGGLFNSRLMTKLREEKGYTYGAYAGFDLRRHGGVFVSRAAVQTDVTAPAVDDTLAEITRMHDTGVLPAELDHVRRYRSQVFPVSFASPGAVADGLATGVVHGRADDYFDAVREAISTVTAPEVDTAARVRLRPDDLVTVVVGDAAQVAGPLGEVGAGPVHVVADES